MNVYPKKRMVLPLLALSILMVTPDTIAMRVTIEMGTNGAKNNQAPRSAKWLIPLALMLIPMYELFDKNSKANFSPDEEYSWKDMKQSIKTIIGNMVGDKKEQTESTKKAWVLLWKNIKNLYHLGFVGQRRKYPGFDYNKEENNLKYRRYKPPRGILGNASSILETSGRALTEILAFVLAGMFIHYTINNGFIFQEFREPRITGRVG